MFHSEICLPEGALRILQRRDAPELFALTEKNREYLRQWLSWLDGVKDAADTEKFIETTQKQFESNNGFQAGIWFQGKIAGCIGHLSIDWRHKKTGLGYWLGSEFQGRGLMTNSCRAFVEHAFSELHLNRVEIVAATGNHKSRAVPERLGFKYEGDRRQYEWLYDHFVDIAAYSVLAQEWKTLRLR